MLVTLTEVTALTEDMLENTWRETDYRLDVLRATKGAHHKVRHPRCVYNKLDCSKRSIC